VLADADKNQDTIYHMDKDWALYAALVDKEVAYNMGVGVFARTWGKRPNPTFQPASYAAMTQEAEWKASVEEHRLLADFAAPQAVHFILQEENKIWVEKELLNSVVGVRQSEDDDEEPPHFESCVDADGNCQDNPADLPDQ